MVLAAAGVKVPSQAEPDSCCDENRDRSAQQTRQDEQYYIDLQKASFLFLFDHQWPFKGCNLERLQTKILFQSEGLRVKGSLCERA